MSKKELTYSKLISKSENELLLIKKEKMEELRKIQNRKIILVRNITTLQQRIKISIKGKDK